MVSISLFSARRILFPTLLYDGAFAPSDLRFTVFANVLTLPPPDPLVKAHAPSAMLSLLLTLFRYLLGHHLRLGAVPFKMYNLIACSAILYEEDVELCSFLSFARRSVLSTHNLGYLRAFQPDCVF